VYVSTQIQIGTSIEMIQALVATLLLTSHKIKGYVKKLLFIDGDS